MTKQPGSVVDGVRVLIFDLDGTLYQGEGFLPRYYDELAVHAGLPREVVERETERILRGEHVLRLGAFYDPVTDRVLHAPSWRIERVLTWEGGRVDDPRHGGDVSLDDDLVYVGDAWQAVLALAAHHQVSAADRDRAFQAVRQAINDTVEAFLDTSALESVLDEVDRFDHRFVMTNTPEHLGQALVEVLGLPARFDGVRYGANKPRGLVRWLEELAVELDVTPQEILCIGDNYFNDILPAIRAGCRTIWIHPFADIPHHGSELRVGGLAEIAPLLRGESLPARRQR